MATSPNLHAEGALHVAVSSDGQAIPDSAQLISVTLRSAINQVPRATLVFADGDMAGQGFPLRDSDDLKPGAQIEVMAGHGDTETTIFSGIVVRHGLSITGSSSARLTVECRDKAVRMTVGRKNARYFRKSDADVITQLIQAHALTARVTSTTTVHDELIQHDCSDWDYLLARAEASGCLVLVSGGTVDVAAPQVSAAAVLAVEHGVDLIEFEADLDASQQDGKVQAGAWSIQAQPLASGLSRLRGRMRFQGSALAEVGKLVDVKGVGERFSGAVFVTGATHRLEDGNWTTEIEFGLPMASVTGRSKPMAPSASGSVPGIEGLHVGVVQKLDEDPCGEHRVQVKVPSAGMDSVWARLLQFSASNAFGAFFAPEIGDEVLLGWLHDDPGFPVVLGSLYSGKQPPPTPLSAKNEIKTLVTRCKARLEFNDEDKLITLLTPGNNRMVFSDKDKTIVITDQNGNVVELGSGGIKLDSPQDIKISAKGAISIDALGAVRVGSQADVHVEGLNVNCTAQVGMVAKGSATAELSASGQTTVKGAVVMIN